jgi:hypothetical protein
LQSFIASLKSDGAAERKKLITSVFVCLWAFDLQIQLIHMCVYVEGLKDRDLKLEELPNVFKTSIQHYLDGECEPGYVEYLQIHSSTMLELKVVLLLLLLLLIIVSERELIFVVVIRREHRRMMSVCEDCQRKTIS